MKSITLKNHLLLLASGLCFAFLFWKQQAALNVFLFSTILSALALYGNKAAWKNRLVQLTIIGSIFTGIMVVWNNSLAAIIIHIIFFYALIGAIQAQSLKSLVFSLYQVLLSYRAFPKTIFEVDTQMDTKPINRRSKWLYHFSLSLIPILIVVVFYVLYALANPRFLSLSNQFWSSIGNALQQFYDSLSIGFILFTCLGLIISAGVLFKYTRKSVAAWEDAQSEFIRRQRKQLDYSLPAHGLKREYRIALLLLVLVNGLLLIVNAIDINWLWFGFTVPDGFNLKQFVHEGTYVLIFSILLSIGIILYFFRRNLNFYPNNKWLIGLANSWMVQNLILAISVALRNYYYIHVHALAYKRIGVTFFLLLTVIGLLSMLVKINRHKSFFYLLRVNALGWYALLIIMSAINWNLVLVNYNLNHWNPKGVDVDFYFDLSPRVSPILEQNLPTIEKQIEANVAANNYWEEYKDIESFKDELAHRKSEWLNACSEYGWPSWNYMDQQALNQLMLGRYATK